LVTEARDWALCWLEQRPGTHCRTLETLAGRPVPADESGQALLDAATEVTAAVRQILLDCICAAVNPPCAPCDDEAVVLAKVAVDCCEVVEICDLARRYAITGTALRYWLPLEWLFCELEKACCGDADQVTQLDQARDVIRSLTTTTDCGWPKRWPAPRSDRRAVEALPAAEPAVTKPDREGKDEVESLRARVAELERRYESLQPRPAPAAATRTAAAGRATTPARPTTAGRPTPTNRPKANQPKANQPKANQPTTRPVTTGRPATRATTTSRTSATTKATPATTKATDAAKNAKNAKAGPAGKGTSTRKGKGKANASSGNENG
jgi:hypothetical protein